MKPKSRWPDAHINLKRLYEERVQEGMSQDEFGATYGIGSQGMVWQYLNGWRPLGIEATAKFATGLRCTIADFSPDMAKALKTEIVPVIGRVAVKAALLLLLAIPPFLQSKAEAAFNITIDIIHIAWHSLAAWLARCLAPIAAALGLVVSGCTTINMHTPAPADWPALTVHERTVSTTGMIAKCYPAMPLAHKLIGSLPIACAWIRFDEGTCTIYLTGWTPTSALEHEYEHCAGRDHEGASNLRDAWTRYKAVRP